MDQHKHDQQMVSVYAHIYGDRYSFDEQELADAKFLITKNVDEFGDPGFSLSDCRVFNIGTGREAMAFWLLGAKEVVLFDMSPTPMKNINALKAENAELSNLHAYQGDFSRDDLSDQGKFDFVYLNGVFHHLHAPAAAARNISRLADTNSKVFLRIYRTGSLQYFAAELVRQFLPIDTDKVLFDKIFVDMLGEFPMDLGQSHDHPVVHLHEMICDNSFVPVLTLFDPQKLISYFEDLGFACVNRPDIPAYDHDNNKKADTGVSLYFVKRSAASALPEADNRLDSVSQLDIPYAEKGIQKTAALFKSVMGKLQGLEIEQKIAIAIKINLICQSKRIYDSYRISGNDSALMQDYAANNASTEAIHGSLQDLLASI